MLFRFAAFRKYRFVVTLEEHLPYGGLGTAVAHYLTDSRNQCELLKISLPERVNHIGSQEWLLKHYELDQEGIVRRIEAFCREIKGV